MSSSPVGDPRRAHVRETGWQDRHRASEFKVTVQGSPPVTGKRPTKDEIRQALRSVNRMEATPGFSSVAAAFDFEHHVGSDPGLELAVLKAILMREGSLSQIEILVQLLMRPQAFVGDEPDYESVTAKVIELLAGTRDQSLEVVETVEKWRSGVVPPPPFVWQDTNYLLKMCSDLDFLSQVPPLVAMLGVSSEGMRHNPLMLENTLGTRHDEDEGDAQAPHQPEMESSSGPDRAVEKARLRRAEAALVLEEGRAHLHHHEERLASTAPAALSKDDDLLVPPALDNGGGAQGWGLSSLRRPMVTELVRDEFDDEFDPADDTAKPKLNLLNWYGEAQAQLTRLREPVAHASLHASKGTGRMEIPRRERLEPMERVAFPSANGLGPVRKLTDLLSTATTALATPQHHERKHSASKPRQLRALTAETYGGDQLRQPATKPKGATVGIAEPMKRTSTPVAAATIAANDHGVATSRVTYESGVGGGADDGNGDEGGGGNNVRPMTPSVQVPLTGDELDEVRKLEQPTEGVAVVAAAVLILLSEGNTVPADVRWSAFVACERSRLLSGLQHFDAQAVPKFKLRALKRFLSIDAFNPVLLATTAQDKAGCVCRPAAKLAVWVLRVIAAHPEGGLFIKEVRTALGEWDHMKEAEELLKPKKKKKMKKKTRKVAIAPAVSDAPGVEGGGDSAKQAGEGPGCGLLGESDPLARLEKDARRCGQAVDKHVAAELKSAVRGTLSKPCSRALEAASLLLNRGKPSLEWAKGAMSKAVKRGDPTFESTVKGFGREEATALVAVSQRAGKVLSGYLSDPDLEPDALKKASKAMAVLMDWVRTAGALYLFLLDEHFIKQRDKAEKNKAATKLQGMQRQREAGKVVAERRKQTQAATLIQGRARITLSKKRLTHIKEDIEAEQQNDAATKLQGMQRQREAGKVVAERREQTQAATLIQRRARMSEAKKRVGEVRARKKDEQSRVKIEFDDEGAERSEPKQIFPLSAPLVRAVSVAVVENDDYQEEKGQEEEEDYGNDDDGAQNKDGVEATEGGKASLHAAQEATDAKQENCEDAEKPSVGAADDNNEESTGANADGNGVTAASAPVSGGENQAEGGAAKEADEEEEEEAEEDYGDDDDYAEDDEGSERAASPKRSLSSRGKYPGSPPKTADSYGDSDFETDDFEDDEE